MNNPAIYPPQHPYGHGNPMAQEHMMPSAPPTSFPQNSFNPGAFPEQFQRPFAPHQPQQQPQLFHPNQNQYIQRPLSQSTLQSKQRETTPRSHTKHELGPPTSQPQSTPQSTPQRPLPPSSTPNHRPTPPNTSGPSNDAMAQVQTPGPNLAQQAQMQNAAQMTRAVPQPTPSLSPSSQARERARVSILLEINTALLQEVVSLQAQGKAPVTSNPIQQSPSSPTSGDPNSALSGSPIDATNKGQKAASPEYAECMRRLQANLSYLASIADAKKKVNGVMPVGPAIMVPPPHLNEVHDLYRKLNQLFPEASQSIINKAMAFASAQSTAKPNNVPAQG